MKAQPLIVTLSRTSDGKEDYMQIMSADQATINIVLLSPEIKINDSRPTGKRGIRR